MSTASVMRGVILYGPPAAGKTTITAALCHLDESYRPYRRLKAGGGRTDGYDITTYETLDRLSTSGSLVWVNEQYGALYAVERGPLAALLAGGEIPIVHLGQPAGVTAVTGAFPAARWVVVEVWCPQDVAAERLAERGTDDIAARLRVWRATARLDTPDMVLNTSRLTPRQCAATIDHCARPEQET